MRLTPRVAGFRLEYPAGFELECMAGFVGTRMPQHAALIYINLYHNCPRHAWREVRHRELSDCRRGPRREVSLIQIEPRQHGRAFAFMVCGLGLRSIKVPEDEDDHGGFRRRSAHASVRPIDVLNALSSFCSSAAAQSRPARFSR